MWEHRSRWNNRVTAPPPHRYTEPILTLQQRQHTHTPLTPTSLWKGWSFETPLHLHIHRSRTRNVTKRVEASIRVTNGVTQGARPHPSLPLHLTTYELNPTPIVTHSHCNCQTESSPLTMVVRYIPPNLEPLTNCRGILSKKSTQPTSLLDFGETNIGRDRGGEDYLTFRCAIPLPLNIAC
jgi:hypothetical protein